jgi:DNA-binding transcriptional MerR regulator
VKKLAGISYRQLQYWESSGLIELEREGRKRDISLQDLCLYICIARLRKEGISIQQIRRHYIGWLQSVIGTIRAGEVIYFIPQKKGLHGLMVAGGQIDLTLKHSIILDMLELDHFTHPPTVVCSGLDEATDEERLEFLEKITSTQEESQAEEVV